MLCKVLPLSVKCIQHVVLIHEFSKGEHSSFDKECFAAA